MAQPHPFFILQDIGLTEKEAAIYMALLSKRRLSVAELARESNVKRATCYEHLDALSKRGFVRREPVGKRTFYSAVDPQRILSDFKKRAAILEAGVKEMAQIQDEAMDKPRVTFFEGKTEIRRIYEEMFQTVGDTRSIFPPKAFFESFSAQEYDEFDKMITAHVFRSKDLFVNDHFYKRIKEIRAKNGGTAKSDKRLPSWFTCNVDVLIYSKKVALISLRDLSAIVIENADVAELFKNLHEMAWRSA